MLRNSSNPILTRADIPFIIPQLVDVSGVFNPGAIKFGEIYKLILRVQSRSRETFLIMAESKDGVKFTVNDHIINFKGIEKIKKRIFHVYDARITPLEGRFFIMFAMDMEDGCQLGLGVTDDFLTFEFLGIISKEDTRNGVLFPEKVDGRYLRMDRPNIVKHTEGPTSGCTIWLSESKNLLDWSKVAPVMHGRYHYWDEFIGSGPPPVKTLQGWLHIYHGVASHFSSANIYQGGVILLDLNDPSRLLGRCRCNILEPREIWELTGQVPNVTFPSGMVVEEFDNEGFALPDSEVKIYYGAADTVVGLIHTNIEELINATRENEII